MLMFVKDVAMDVRDHCQQMIQGSHSANNDFNEKRDPQVVFYMLDAMLKDTLDRLKAMR